MKTTQLLQRIKENIIVEDEKEYFDIHVIRYLETIKIINNLKLPQSSKILDIGCYPPHLYNYLRENGHEVWGVSSIHEPISDPQIKILDIEHSKLPFDSNKFDLVVFSEVIEHLTTHPGKILSEIRRILKPDGYLLITTPNVLRTQNLIKMIISKNIYFDISQLNGNPNHRHNREYTLAEISDLLKVIGLSIYNSGYFISYSPVRQRNKSDSIQLKAIKWLNYCLMKLLPSRSDTIYVIGRKQT